MIYCAINGQQINTLSVQDRGLAYGDGIFTTAKVNQGKIELLTEHIARLKIGCERLGLTSPDFVLLTEQVKNIAKTQVLAVLKIMITAGSGGRGYSRLNADHGNVIVYLFNYPKHYLNWQKNGIYIGVSQLKLGLNPMLAGLKHLNRLEQVLIRQELDQRKEDDLIVLDINEKIIESSCANLFWLLDGVWYSPKIQTAGIAGLMRNKILTTIPEVNLVSSTLDDLITIDAMFICNSVMGVVPIENYNGRHLSIMKVDQLSAKLST